MTAKTTGADFKRFYLDPDFWSGSAYHDDANILVDGVDQDGGVDVSVLADNAVVEIDGGYVCGLENDNPTLEEYFKRWLKKQKIASMLVECDINRLDAVKDAIRSVGGRIIQEP